MLVSLLSYNTQLADHDVGQSLITEEVESIAADLVQSTFDEFAELDFDATADPVDENDLTPEAQFGGVAAWDDASDLDDLDGMTVTRHVVGAEGGTFDFVLGATVEYVEKDGDAWDDTGGSRSLFKQVTLTLWQPGADPAGPPAVVLRSVYAASGV